MIVHFRIIDCFNFKSEDISFWTEPKSYDQVVTVGDGSDLAGKVLLNRHADGASWQKYIKWIDVDPETEYTLSFMTRADVDGANSCGILDSNYNNVIEVYQVDVDKEWSNISFSFTTGDNDKIGMFISDGGGETAYTDFRLFKTVNGKTITVPSYAIQELPENPENGGKSPETGNRSLMIILYSAFSSLMALGVLTLVRKKEDNV